MPKVKELKGKQITFKIIFDKTLKNVGANILMYRQNLAMEYEAKVLASKSD
jgi:hypothetical protein